VAMDDAFEHAVRLVEAFIFASAEPVAVSALSRLVPMPYSAREVLETLRERCQGRGAHLVEVGGGWQFRTALDLAPELVWGFRCQEAFMGVLISGTLNRCP
jgi:segregation and condensation protein B